MNPITNPDWWHFLRLTNLLLKLNAGEQIESLQQAREFEVDVRTIRLDMERAFDFLSLKVEEETTYEGSNYRSIRRYTVGELEVGEEEIMEEGKLLENTYPRHKYRYALDPEYVGKMSFKTIGNAARNARFNIYARDEYDGVAETGRTEFNDALQEHPVADDEDVQRLKNDFFKLQRAIRECRLVRFAYPEGNEIIEVAPYRLFFTSFRAEWYFAASKNGQPEAFLFENIRDLEILEATYTPNDEILKIVDEENCNQWISGNDRWYLNRQYIWYC